VKKLIFLTGAMGSGKSTILSLANAVEQSKYIVHCQEFDILGTKQIGADSLSGERKDNVLLSLKNYSGVLVVAGEYYSKQVDIKRYADMGFIQSCILLNVERDVVYGRVLQRGSGSWNEKTYSTNMTNRVNFFKAFPYYKAIWKNNYKHEIVQNFNRLKELCKP